MECEPCPVTLPDAELQTLRPGRSRRPISTATGCRPGGHFEQRQQQLLGPDQPQSAAGTWWSAGTPPVRWSANSCCRRQPRRLLARQRRRRGPSSAACGWDPPLVSSLGNTDAGTLPRLQRTGHLHSRPAAPRWSAAASIPGSLLPGGRLLRPVPRERLLLRLPALEPAGPAARQCASATSSPRPHTGLGEARLRADAGPDTLTVSNIGSSGLDGVSIDLGQHPQLQHRRAPAARTG